MTKEDKIKYIMYRFKKRDPEYPVNRVKTMSSETIDSVYQVEKQAEEDELAEEMISVF